MWPAVYAVMLMPSPLPGARHSRSQGQQRTGERVCLGVPQLHHRVERLCAPSRRHVSASPNPQCRLLRTDQSPPAACAPAFIEHGWMRRAAVPRAHPAQTSGPCGTRAWWRISDTAALPQFKIDIDVSSGTTELGVCVRQRTNVRQIRMRHQHRIHDLGVPAGVSRGMREYAQTQRDSQ